MISGSMMCLLLLISCSSSKPMTETKKESGERSVFINLKITADSVSKNSHVEELDKIVTMGHFDYKHVVTEGALNYLTCILYEDQVSMDTVVVQHPLYRIYEYMMDNGQTQYKEYNQKEAKFSLRFQLKGKTARIKIIEKLVGLYPKEIASINL